jgi:hypothetical protein
MSSLYHPFWRGLIFLLGGIWLTLLAYGVLAPSQAELIGTAKLKVIGPVMIIGGLFYLFLHASM